MCKHVEHRTRLAKLKWMSYAQFVTIKNTGHSSVEVLPDLTTLLQSKKKLCSRKRNLLFWLREIANTDPSERSTSVHRLSTFDCRSERAPSPSRAPIDVWKGIKFDPSHLSTGDYGNLQRRNNNARYCRCSRLHSETCIREWLLRPRIHAPMAASAMHRYCLLEIGIVCAKPRGIVSLISRLSVRTIDQIRYRYRIITTFPLIVH